MATITVMDPVTRIEGHLKVEVTIDPVGGALQVVDARCTGTLFRGFETLLQGRSPTDAPVLTQRICGVCPVSHGMASTLALEDAAGFGPPTNARVLRNLVLGANFLQSHLLHFYLLAAFDYVRGPQTAPWTPAWEVDFRDDPRLEPLLEHVVMSLEARRRAHAMGAIFGGRMPAPHTYLAGGFTAVPTEDAIARFRNELSYLTNFIRQVYVPDAEALAEVYADHFSVGQGCGNLLAFGVFELDDGGSSKLLSPGIAANGSSSIEPLDTAAIAESVRHSWYHDQDEGLHPSAGDTSPVFPKSGAYSWLKAPRHGGTPHEVGPLARMWVSGHYQRGVSVMDRHLARAHEALLVAESMREWLYELEPGAPVYSQYTTPASAAGVGLTEAPRGALGHWVDIASGRIARYQVITPTCWNTSPRDAAGVVGPMEDALIGTPVTDPDRPVEALRVIHSYDPCLSCAVHVMRPDGEPTVVHTGAGAPR